MYHNYGQSLVGVYTYSLNELRKSFKRLYDFRIYDCDPGGRPEGLCLYNVGEN